MRSSEQAPVLTDEQRNLLEAVAVRWRETGEWTTVGPVLAEHRRKGLNFRSILDSLPSELCYTQERGEHERIELTIAGLECTKAGAFDAAAVVRLIQLLVNRYCENPSAGTASDDDLRTIVGSEYERDLPRIARLFMAAWGGGQGPNADGAFKASTGPHTLRFDKVSSAWDYIVRRQRTWRVATDLTDAHVALMREVYAYRLAHGEWPLVVPFVIQHRSEPRTLDLLQEIPDRFVRRFVAHESGATIRLTIDGVARVTPNSEHELFVQVVRCALAHFDETGGEGELSSTEIARKLDRLPDEIRQLGEFIDLELPDGIRMYRHESGWSLKVGPDIANWDGVKTWDEYMHRRDQPPKSEFGLFGSSLGEGDGQQDESAEESETLAAEEGPPPPRVLISYSHDSDEHMKGALQLAHRLRDEGVDARIDQFFPNPPEGWPRWEERETREAQFVIVVCSETYLRRFNGEEMPGKGRGASFEGLVIAQDIHDASGHNDKFLPVLFASASEKDIPRPLKPVTRYHLPADYEKLYRRITNQPSLTPTPIGPLKRLPPLPLASAPPSSASAPTASNDQQQRFVPLIRSRFAAQRRAGLSGIDSLVNTCVELDARVVEELSRLCLEVNTPAEERAWALNLLLQIRQADAVRTRLLQEWLDDPNIDGSLSAAINGLVQDVASLRELLGVIESARAERAAPVALGHVFLTVKNQIGRHAAALQEADFERVGGLLPRFEKIDGLQVVIGDIRRLLGAS